MLGGGSFFNICGSGTEYSPRFIHPFASEAWHTLKSVVEGTNVKIYMNDQLVTEVTLTGEEADSKTDNYVGLWCHARTLTRGDSFEVTTGRGEVEIAQEINSTHHHDHLYFNVIIISSSR